MPKALSLKQNTNKNQKPITQFFKNTQTVKNELLPNIEQSNVKINPKSNKRKVLSPVNDNQTKGKGDFVEQVSIQSPKKIKCEDEIMSPIKLSNIYEREQKDIRSPCKSLVTAYKKNTSEVEATEEHYKNGDSKTTLSECIKKIEQFATYKSNLTTKENCASKSCKENVTKSEINNIKNKSPTKSNEVSPIKKNLIENHDDEYNFDHNDLFDEEWEVCDMKEDILETLNLSVMQRCHVLTVRSIDGKLEVLLKNDANEKGTCLIEGVWCHTPICPGEVVSVIASRDQSGRYSVSNTAGLLVLRPDHLVSSTSVVAGVFCKRKAVLQERWRGIDSANSAMTVGTLIHELVQKALTQRITSVAELRKATENIVRDSIQMLYDAGLAEEEAMSNMQAYISPLAEFMQTYVVGNDMGQQTKKDNFNGRINEVVDIEENVCCHQLGLKGKIDATLQVTLRDRKGDRKAIVPLELKSGRPSGSAEHRGQLVLYGMMLALQDGQHPAEALSTGLLLYLKERVDLREVTCGYPEKRDLIMLRNDLVQHLAAGPNRVDPEQIADIEDVPGCVHQSLPEPVNNSRACASCPYLTICSLHLWHTDEQTVSESHPLVKLKSEALGHLTPDHIRYFLQWTGLLMLEERGQVSTSPLHALWTETPEERSKRGVCAANLKLKSVSQSEGRYLHVFHRENAAVPTNGHQKVLKGPQEGEFSIVSVDKRPWVAAGVVCTADDLQVQIVLERDLGRRHSTHTWFHIDMYESYSATVQNLTNLGVLMEDSDRAHRLRRLIIDKEEAVFSEKLPREVGRLGARLLRGLNLGQQRAVLRALAAQRYVLLRGLPGTGKTQTVTVLVQLLVALRLRVLVTANAHAAVDNVLARLPETLRVLRLGAAARVAPALLARSEQTLTAGCTSVKQLQELYDSMDVVGVTCLGSAHAMLARTKFDVCIVDEATQVLQSTVIRPLVAAARIVLVGDPEQLPPVVRAPAARRLGMEVSLFHRLLSEQCTCTLSAQYRMNEPLAALANAVSYDGQLQCANQTVAQATMTLDLLKLPCFSEEDQWLKIACSHAPEDAAVFFDLELPNEERSNNKSLCNAYEASVVMALIVTLTRGGVLAMDIGVIAPYREQVALLRRCVSNGRSTPSETAPDVSTVDQFQGRDKSVIIYSGTKRVENVDKRVKEGEVLNDHRRLAVTVTRAKHKLLVVGSARALARYAPLTKLMDSCKTVPMPRAAVQRIHDTFMHLFA